MKYSQYFTIEQQILKAGHIIERSELIYSFTEGATTSLKDLSPAKYNEFCSWLKQTFGLVKKDWQDTPENKMRRKIIMLFKKMNYTTAKGKADMESINHWAVKYGYLKKPLNDYTAKELPKLVTQAERMYNSYVNAI